jgi:Flp pilus assembly protein TadD
VEAHVGLGYILEDRGRPAEAEAALRRAIALRPEDAVLHYDLGNLLRNQKKLDQAVAAFRDSIKLNPDYAQAHCNLGHALLFSRATLRRRWRPSSADTPWGRGNPDGRIRRHSG